MQEKVKDGLCIGNAEMIDKTNVVELAELGRITGSTEPLPVPDKRIIWLRLGMRTVKLKTNLNTSSP